MKMTFNVIVPPSDDSNLDSNRKKEVIPVVVQQPPVEEVVEMKVEPVEEEDPNRSTPLSQKRLSDEPVDSPASSKKLCVVKQEVQIPLEDDLSEISDDADDILNREEIQEAPIDEQPVLSEAQETIETTEQKPSPGSQKSQTPPPVQPPVAKSPVNNKPASIDEDNMELDFEEV